MSGLTTFIESRWLFQNGAGVAPVVPRLHDETPPMYAVDPRSAI
jgi:hypothetical protein